MKKIMFRGLGPLGNVIYEDKIYKDGAIVELPEDIANAYIKLSQAYEVKSEEEIEKAQELITKNQKEREKALAAASVKEKKGGK